MPAAAALSPTPPVRVAARVVLLRDGRLLTIQMRDGRGEFFILPGGGQRHGESLIEAARREVMEETGFAVEIGDLLYVRDYIGALHDNPGHRRFHQVEVVFAARLVEVQAASCKGSMPDHRQTGIRWMLPADVPTVRFYPEALKADCANGHFPRAYGYLGSVN
ncbi:MAG: NUDIX domain-containing protein [Opitutales bacterium]